MLQYDVGDRVEVVPNHGGVDVGETGVVTAVHPGAAGDRITVLLDSTNRCVLMYPYELKLLVNHSDQDIDQRFDALPPVEDEPVDYSAITRSFCR
jgi:hypothetical protein